MTCEPGSKVKICRTCHRELPVSEFYARRESRDGYAGECRTCNNTRCRERARAQSRELKARRTLSVPDGRTNEIREYVACGVRCKFYAHCMLLVNDQLARPPWERSTESPPCFADSPRHARFLKAYATFERRSKAKPDAKQDVQLQMEIRV